MYRAQGSSNYKPKNVNAANLIGVMWYLQHEVMTQNPPKFGISRILRYKVQTKAPAALVAKRMNFGVRYAYDSQRCTGPGRCDLQYERYGYFVGCNKFKSMYPYPNKKTYYPGGVWYSFPGRGNCQPGPPTGETDCTYTDLTWPPEEISLEELQGNAGRRFWDNPTDETANHNKVVAAAEAFKRKYPSTEELEAPSCDFDFDRFWN